MHKISLLLFWMTHHQWTGIILLQIKCNADAEVSASEQLILGDFFHNSRRFLEIHLTMHLKPFFILKSYFLCISCFFLYLHIIIKVVPITAFEKSKFFQTNTEIALWSCTVIYSLLTSFWHNKKIEHFFSSCSFQSANSQDMNDFDMDLTQWLLFYQRSETHISSLPKGASELLQTSELNKIRKKTSKF